MLAERGGEEGDSEEEEAEEEEEEEGDDIDAILAEEFEVSFMTVLCEDLQVRPSMELQH